MKIVLSGIALVGTVVALLGALVSPTVALPVLHPQTSRSVSYFHHRYHHHRHHPYHHGGGISIHL